MGKATRLLSAHL